ncbi:MAG: hypothetical protein ACR2ID_10630 [Chthoniobacterales bacterium]
MLEELRGLLQKVPFAPFRVHLADGPKLDVPHPDFICLPRSGVLYIYHEQDHFGERINPLLVASVESANGAEFR